MRKLLFICCKCLRMYKQTIDENECTILNTNRVPVFAAKELPKVKKLFSQ